MQQYALVSLIYTTVSGEDKDMGKAMSALYRATLQGLPWGYSPGMSWGGNWDEVGGLHKELEVFLQETIPGKMA